MARHGNQTVAAKLIGRVVDRRILPTSSKLDGATPWHFLALLTTISATGALALNMLVPAIPRMATALASDAEAVQMTISLYLAGLAIAQLFVGALSDRFGRRPVLLIGLVLAGGASIACIAMSNIYGLVAMRVVQAFGSAAGQTNSRAIIRDVFDREHSAKVLSIVASAMTVAPMVAPLLGGIVETFFGWQGIFLFTGLVPLSVAVWVWFVLPETRSRAAEAVVQDKFVPTVVALAKDPRFIGFAFHAALSSAAFFIFLGAGPHVIITMMGRSSAEYGLWFMPTAGGFLVGNVITTRMAVRLGIERMLLWGHIVNMTGAVGGVIWLFSVDSIGPLAIVLPSSLMAIANGILLPNGIAGAISIRPQVAGTASGFLGFLQMGCGALLTQFAGHLVVNATSAAPMIYAMFVAVVVCLLFYPLVLRPTKASDPSR